MEEIREEFDEFFAEHDASVITNTEHEDREKLDVELRKTLYLYDQGIKSGKITMPMDYSSDDKVRYQ